MLGVINIKDIHGKTLHVGRFESFAAAVEFFKTNLKDANLTGAKLRNANLTDANLTDANLTDANLRYANLRYANLTDANLTDANLRYANLTDANLTGAKLRNANLTAANLTGAKLRTANLTDANLTGANIDFSSWPLWCGSFGAITDEKQQIQILEHGFRLIEKNGSKEMRKILELEEIKNIRKRFHHK